MVSKFKMMLARLLIHYALQKTRNFCRRMWSKATSKATRDELLKRAKRIFKSPQPNQHTAPKSTKTSKGYQGRRRF